MIQQVMFHTRREKKELIDFLNNIRKKAKNEGDRAMCDKALLCAIGTEVEYEFEDSEVN